uniref:Uncharacterized protein n=1 Tax=Globodera rostochiensis TaxID=31243 RepID=A0A914I4A3_GLORO
MIALTLIPLHLLTFIVAAVFIVLAQCCACCKGKRVPSFASANDSNYSTLGKLDARIFVEKKPGTTKGTPAVAVKKPETPKGTPAVAVKKPETPKGTPAVAEKKPEAPKGTPAVAVKKPETPKGTPAVAEKKPEAPKGTPAVRCRKENKRPKIVKDPTAAQRAQPGDPTAAQRAQPGDPTAAMLVQPDPTTAMLVQPGDPTAAQRVQHADPTAAMLVQPAEKLESSRSQIMAFASRVPTWHEYDRFKVDIWSFGVVGFQCANCGSAAKSPLQIPFSAWLVRSAIDTLLTFEPNIRPNISDCVKLPWFTSVADVTESSTSRGNARCTQSTVAAMDRAPSFFLALLELSTLRGFDILRGFNFAGSAGTSVVIELKDETAVEGVVDSADPKSLNTQLSNVVLYRRRQKGLRPLHLPNFFVKGKYIRFVHFENYATALHLLKQSLRKKLFVSMFVLLFKHILQFFRRFFSPFAMSLLILLTLCPFCATLKEIARNRCELKLVADYEFFRVIGNGNYANAARYLINLIERVNGIFGSVDWGLDITGHRLVNIGFAIKEIKILDKPNFSSSTHFNAAMRPVDGVNSMEMLDSFSAEEGTNATCLCLLVTAKVLSSGVLGLANIGYQNEFFKRGICAREIENGTFYRNTALFSVRRRHELMITRVVDLVAAHELGHAFGSTHDDVHDADCVPQPSRDGRYMMWESANTGYERNHYQFSPCSVRAIHRVLYSLAHRCFVEERRALCGNGILEAGEQCDCGAQIGGTGPAGEGDRCCTADCRLKPSALCSPRHSECCTNNCTFMERGRLCQGRSEEMCKDESRCSGISDKCPPPNPLADGTVCPDEGKCRAGECISFCASLSADLSPCLCEEDKNACRRCCRSRQHSGGADGGGGHCAPVQPFRWLPEGSMCVHGQCQRSETTTGGGGQKAMMCEKKATDSASFFHRLLDNFKGPAPRKFFTDYLVFIVVTVTLFIWFPSGVFIMCMDQQKHKQLVQKRVAAEHNVQVVRSRKRVTPQRSRTLNGIATITTANGNAGGGTTTASGQQQLRQRTPHVSRSSDALQSLLMRNGGGDALAAGTSGGCGGGGESSRQRRVVTVVELGKNNTNNNQTQLASTSAQLSERRAID